MLASAVYFPETIRRLATLGYQHEGDLGIAGREAFRAPPGLFAHHLYVCLPNCEEFRRHILLRDYLRSHPVEASAYSSLKWALFARFSNDRAAYIQGKDDFVKQLVQRAIAWSPLSPTSRGSLD
ncbi:MAG: GrpB family protein [Verrucomicrobia bacterium]|nr:GrpB family protein [Verrucomicrobiota bacterium]